MLLRGFFRFSPLRSLQLFQLLRFGYIITISVVLSRFVLDKSLIGFYEKLMLIGTVSTSFWVSGIINPLLPFYSSKGTTEQKTLISNVVLLLSIISLFATLVLYLFGRIIIHDHAGLYYIFLVFNLFNAPAFLFEYVLLLKKRTKGLIVYGLLIFAGQTAAVALPLIWDKSLQTSIYMLALTGLLRYVFMVIFISRVYGWNFNRNQLDLFRKKVSPYLFSTFIGSSMGYIDSIFISIFFSSADFAIFRYGSRENFIVLLMANAFSNVMSAEVASYNHKNNLTDGLADLKKKSLKMMHLLFPVTIILLLVSKFAFRFVYTSAFESSATIFNIYLLITISRLVFPQTVLLGLQENKLLLKAAVAEWIANILLDIIFLYFFGMQGIAFATFLTYFLEKSVLAYYCHNKGIRLSSYTPVRQWIIYSGLTLLAFLAAHWL